MRKFSIIALLLTLSCASALTIDINSPDTIMDRDENLTINYEINLDSEAEIQYQLLLINEKSEFIILDTNNTANEIAETINYNISQVASGEYELALRLLKPLDYTIKAENNITIRKDINLDINVPETIYINQEQEVINITLQNYGNTDLSISAYFKNTESEISLNPQSLKLEHNTTRQLKATITKPASDYQTTLIILSGDGEQETSNEYSINVIIPVINLELGNVTISEQENTTTIKAEINNTGNIDLNVTINVRTFKLLEGFKTEQESIIIPSNQVINYTKTIDKKQIASVGVTYQQDGENQTIIQELSPINTIPIDLKLSPERLMLLIGVIIVVLIIAYFKLKWRRRP